MKITEYATNPSKCISYGPFCVYAILNSKIDGEYKFGPLEFEHPPIYVGQGNLNRPAASLQAPWLKEQFKTEKDEKIYEIRYYAIPRIIAYFDNKYDAKLVEAKVLHLIPKNYLTNANFPYLKPEERILYKSECFVAEFEMKNENINGNIIKTKRELMKKLKLKNISCGGENDFRQDFLIFNYYKKLTTDRELQQKIKFKMKDGFWKDSIIFEQSLEEVAEILDIKDFYDLYEQLKSLREEKERIITELQKLN